MKKLLVALFLLLPTMAFAIQQSEITIPFGVTTPDNQSTTIVATNVFQTVFSASVGRVSCSIQNKGTNTMLVYFNSDTATSAKSVSLAAGQAVNCDSNGIVIKTAVQITGTIGDAYYAAQW